MKLATFKHWLLLVLFFLLSGDSALRAVDEELPRITVQDILDLKDDGVHVFVFSSASRELFVTHEGDETKLYQWNITQKKLLHTYLLPRDHYRWDEAAVSPDGKLLVAATYPGDDFSAH